MLFKKATQDVVQQFARVDRLQVQRRFAARFELQHALAKEAVSAISIGAQAAGTVNKLGAKSLVQQSQQMRIGNLAVVRSKPRACALAFNLDATQSRTAQEPIIARQGEQAFDARLR